MTIYHEKISSRKTEWLFVSLTILFFLLFVWRMNVSGWNGLTVAILVFACFFLFYLINYRTLIIRITSDALKLSLSVISKEVRD